MAIHFVVTPATTVRVVPTIDHSAPTIREEVQSPPDSVFSVRASIPYVSIFY